jgi:hypothetical protein
VAEQAAEAEAADLAAAAEAAAAKAATEFKQEQEQEQEQEEEEEEAERVAAAHTAAAANTATSASNDAEEDRGPHVPGLGILLFAYNPKQAAMHQYVKFCEESARTFKKHNDIDITFVSNVRGYDVENSPFDNVMNVPLSDIPSARQWWTRTKYLGKSPYNVTLAVDCDAWCCSPFTHRFRAEVLDETLPVDIAANNHAYSGDPNHLSNDNGVILYRTNHRTRRFFAKWTKAQPKTGGDQGVMRTQLMHSKSWLRIGVLVNELSSRVIPCPGESWGLPRKHDHTLLLTAPVIIVHIGALQKSLGNPGAVCELYNKPEWRQRNRIIAWERHNHEHPKTVAQLHEQMTVVFSQKACGEFFGRSCNNVGPFDVTHAPIIDHVAFGPAYDYANDVE